MRVKEDPDASQRKLAADPDEDRGPIKKDEVAGLQRDKLDSKNQICNIVEGDSQESGKRPQAWKKDDEDKPEFEKDSQDGAKRQQQWMPQKPELQRSPGNRIPGHRDVIVKSLSGKPVQPGAA